MTTLTHEQIAELRRLERAWHDAPDHTLERTGAKAEYEMCIRNAAPALLDAAEHWLNDAAPCIHEADLAAAIARAEEAEKAERARIVAWLRAREAYWQEVAKKQFVNPNLTDPNDTGRRCKAMADGYAEAVGCIERDDHAKGGG